MYKKWATNASATLAVAFSIAALAGCQDLLSSQSNEAEVNPIELQEDEVGSASEMPPPSQEVEIDGLKLSPCYSYSCFARASFDETTPSQVGVIERGRLKTNMTSGYLLHGPYAKIDAGTYRLSLNGIIEAANFSSVDVVSDGGATVHALFELTEGKGLVLDETVNIPMDASDLEIRILVSDATIAQFTGVSLKKE